jgi:hypothetical protein
LCLDINLQRLRYFKPSDLAGVQQETGKTIAQISAICEDCPNLPLREA